MIMPGTTMIGTRAKCLLIAIGLSSTLTTAGTMLEAVSAQNALGKNWQAVAPGVVEPRSGEIKISASVVGRISEVLVKINDKVLADEPLVRLDDEDAQARVASAQAQVAMRERARNEKAAGKSANRRDAEDAVADAEARLADVRNTFDKAVRAKR